MTSTRPITEQRIEKHLIKTGVKEVDEELLLASLCLTRIEKKYNADIENSAVAGAAASASSQPKHYVESAIGSLVDATGRSDMGSRPDDLLHTKDAVLHRTDVTVAAGAIRRVANAAATALHELDACKAELAFLREKTARQEAELLQQRKQINFYKSQLEHFSSPQAIFEAFKSVWEAQAVIGASKTEEQIQTMHQHMSQMDKNKRLAKLLSKEAIARQQILDDTTDNTMAIVGDIDVDKIGALFKAQEDNRRGGGDDEEEQQDDEPTGVIDTQLNVMDMDEGNGTNENLKKSPTEKGGVSSATELSAETQKMLSEQARQCEYHVQERVSKYTTNAAAKTSNNNSLQQRAGITNSRQAAEAILECDHPVQFSRQNDAMHFVIRRSTADKSQRIVRMQGSSTSIVGKLTSAILYSPADILQIEVDMKSTLGRKQQLQIQAEELHLTEVWNELCLYSRPYLNVVHFRINKSLEMQSKLKDFDVRPLVVDDTDGVVEFEEKRRQQEKRLAFRRLEEGIMTSRDGGEGTISNHHHFLVSDKIDLNAAASSGGDAFDKDRDELKEYTTQIPGIIRFISNKRGQSTSGYWHDPIEAGQIRVSASSVMRPAELVSIVKPFRDRHSNFFCTKDEPGQYVEISFEQMSIIPTGYSISSTHPINGCYFPRSWRIEASPDRVRWHTLLRHVNDDSISRYSPTWAWSLPREVQRSSFYSHFRIVNEGPNASGGDALCISSFEVYGKLVYITKEMTLTNMSFDATIPNDRPKGFSPMAPLPVVKDTKPVAAKKSKKG